MADLAVRLAKAKKKPQEDDDAPTHPDEKKALNVMRREAEVKGVTLANDGKGGLPPSLVLGCLRRDRWRCKRCGGKKNLTLHHKGHLENPESKWLEKKGHSNDPNNLVVLCANKPDGSPGCHDDIHNEDRSRK